jgi:AcrR family transcriptional regulator
MSSTPDTALDSPTRSRGGRDPAETKARLLEAAGQLFAERGYEGTSMRAVTQAAGVSVSAANYHFGSKEALLLATLGQVVIPINRERLERLDAVERAAGSSPPRLEEVLDAFLAPAVEGSGASSGRDQFRQLAARLYSDPPHVVAAFKEENFAPLSLRFIDVLARVLPDRDRSDIAIAFQLIVGMMVHVISGQLELGNRAVLDEAATPRDGELLDEMIRFAAAGLRQTPAGEKLA